MSDRRRNAPDPISETDRQYLERTGVNNQIKDVLTKIIENRPRDPVTFLSDYFDTVSDKAGRANKAYQQICLTHHSRPAFHNNIRIAYEILSQQRVHKDNKGVNGSSYMELLTIVCLDFPGIVTEKLFKKLRCRDYEVVTFEVFRSGIFTCLVLQDFMKQSGDLFTCLDPGGTGKVERPLAEAVMDQLSKAVSTTGDSFTSVLDSGYLLTPSNLHDTLSQALLQTKDNKKTMSQEEFQTIAAEAFVAQVKSLR